MRPQRIKTGFHRIGIVLAAICIVVGFYNAIGSASFRDAFSSLITAAVLYALATGLGWIVAGFMGDGENG
jgi:hypothetical protein